MYCISENSSPKKEQGIESIVPVQNEQKTTRQTNKKADKTKINYKNPFLIFSPKFK